MNRRAALLAWERAIKPSDGAIAETSERVKFAVSSMSRLAYILFESFSLPARYHHGAVS